MTLEEMIQACIDAKEGNKEFQMGYMLGGEAYHTQPSCADEPRWCAGIGNPDTHCPLGEVTPEVNAEGFTLEEAVRNLLAKLTA